MKTMRVVGLLISMVSAVSTVGCATWSSSDQRAVVGTAIAIVVVGAAVAGGRDNEKHLQEDAPPQPGH